MKEYNDCNEETTVENCHENEYCYYDYNDFRCKLIDGSVPCERITT